ncbi:MAG: hypothetical protein NWQ44_00680 [Flavobacteriales bacterium]|nr:hypothetical protein [Flavobacteriales bacterium]MDP4817901.1 hypothetical protein [Flavobacteriales bacterium]MDP4950222.1 hypothetical protein [Flavobacteriales bacterium]
MKNNEWNIPSDYFEKNKKALMPVRKFPTGKWLLVLAAACVIGVGFFMWKGKDRNQEVAQQQKVEDKRGEEKVREGKIENESLVKRGEEMVREGKSKEEVAEGLKEIPREELVAYLLEEDTDLIENIN